MIELTAVRLERPRVAAPLLDGADLRVGRGEVVLVTAPAGAGTSTLIDAVLGEALPRMGNVTVFGRDLARLRHSSLLAMRRRFGVVPQRLELLLERTALANVALPLEIDHLPRRLIAARAAAWLDRVGVTGADQLAGELSLAEQQRVALARALVREPRVVVADQPTAHQDAKGAALVAALLAEAAEGGAAVLVASRDPHLGTVARERGWRHVAIAESRLISLGVSEASPAEVRDPASAEITIEVDLAGGDSRPRCAMSGAVVMVPKVLPFPVTARTRGVG